MNVTRFVLCAISIVFLQGCATVFTGYYNVVELKDAPDSLRVFTSEGVEIPVVRTVVHERSAEFENVRRERPIVQITLRSNLDPVLILKSNVEERRVQVFGKIQAGWFLLDVVFGVPWIVDAITGNWNAYESIDAGFK